MWPTRIVLCRLVLILFVMLSAGCQPSQSDKPPTITPRSASTDTPEPPPPELTPTATLNPDTPVYRVQFKVTTSSDWTHLALVSGASWYDLTITSRSGQIQDAIIEDNAIYLSQSLSNAEQKKEVEIVVDALLANLDLEEPIRFAIERGFIGATQVEILRFDDETISSVATVVWDGIKESDPNTEVYEISPQPFLGSNTNEYVTIAQLNFWFSGAGPYGGFENPDGSRATPFTPYYGDTYNVADPDWMYQQIEWAVEYGVDAFSIEWTTPAGAEEGGGTMEDIIDYVFLKSPNIHKVRWVIFYDFVLRIIQTKALADLGPGEWRNFDNPRVYDTFVEDMVHFATKYFNNPQYLTIDGRPVIYVWAARAWYGNYAGAIAEAREKVAELGYDVFIVGDLICYPCDFNRALVSQFDASTVFVSLYRPPDEPGPVFDLGPTISFTDDGFTWWQRQIANLKVAGRNETAYFQPAWSPQLDDRFNKRVEDPMTYLAASREQVQQMAEVGSKHAQPAGEEGLKLVWINTWNCWKEATTIEPTIIDDKPKYPGGNYGFDFLEIIRDVYGVETYYTSP
jgi:hypothetical protein